MATPIRVGAVSYLNAKPLYYGLCDIAPDVRLTMDVPSRLAEQLAAGELDVALIPSVEYLRGVGRGYEIIPGFAIAARGPVRSVKLFSRVPWDEVESVGARCRLADEPGSGADLARRSARGAAAAGGRAAAWGLGAREHGRRGAGHRRPGHASAARAVPRSGRPGRGVASVDRLCRSSLRSGSRAAGSIWASCRRPWSRAAHWGWPQAGSLARMHGQRLGLDVADVLRLLDANSVVRPRGTRAGRT